MEMNLPSSLCADTMDSTQPPFGKSSIASIKQSISQNNHNMGSKTSNEISLTMLYLQVDQGINPATIVGVDAGATEEAELRQV